MKKFLRVVMMGIMTLWSLSAGAFSVIRDTEIETTLLAYIRPIFKAAGLNPTDAEVVIINDPSINAFVAGGQTIFVHTGLILKAHNPDELVFVLSHETGHIVGGHIVRGYEAMEKAQTTALISTVIGGILAVASGHPDAGVALMMGGQSSAQGMFAKYRQTEESSADRVAVDILGKLGYSMSGFDGIMKTIKSEERLNDGEVYLRTHPVTQTRINELSRFLTHPVPVHSEKAFDLMQAKLSGFLEKPEKTLKKYVGTGVVDGYAQAIASYKKREFNRAFEQIDALIKMEPNNPYFYELKGQLLFETGRLSESAIMYGKAYQLKKDSDLIALSYAQVLLELGGVDNAKQAEQLLHFVCQKDPDTLFAWQLLGKAYDRQGKKVESEYAMAEYDRVSGRIRMAQDRAKKVIKQVPKDSPIYQRLRDILDRKEEE